MGAPSTTKISVSSASARSNRPRPASPLTPYSETAQASSSTSTPGPSSSSSRAHNRRSHHGHHAHAHGHHSHHTHSYFPQPIIYTPHELFAISPDWSETVRARLQLLSSPEVLARSPLEEQPPASPSSGGYLFAGNSKKRRRSHCIHDLPVHARRSIVEEDDAVDVDHTPKLSTAKMDGVEGEGRGMAMEDEEEEEDRGRSRSRRSSMASFKTRRSERSLSRRAGTKSRRQSEGQRDRAALMAILATTPLETPS